ncbi:MAG: hypothetical protein ACI8WB_005845 [Phenylobacterium sp.]|jgi:hypothetical protein
MNKELLKAIDAAISNVKKLSDTQLQAKFEANKNGPIGHAVSEGEVFSDFLTDTPAIEQMRSS